MKATPFAVGLFVVMVIAPVAWAQSAGGGGSTGGGASEGGASSEGRGGSSSSATAPGAGGAAAPSTTGTGTQLDAPNSTMATPGRLDSATPTDPNLQTSRQPPGTGQTLRPGQAGTNGQLAPNSTGDGTNVPLSTDSSRVSASGASSGGRPMLGARGDTLRDCMDTWDKKTHITKKRWREICSRTLTEPHL
jgi:hypothetical protein